MAQQVAWTISFARYSIFYIESEPWSHVCFQETGRCKEEAKLTHQRQPEGMHFDNWEQNTQGEKWYKTTVPPIDHNDPEVECDHCREGSGSEVHTNNTVFERSINRICQTGCQMDQVDDVRSHTCSNTETSFYVCLPSTQNRDRKKHTPYHKQDTSSRHHAILSETNPTKLISSSWARTSDLQVNSLTLYQLSHGGIYSYSPTNLFESKFFSLQEFFAPPSVFSQQTFFTTTRYLFIWPNPDQDQNHAAPKLWSQPITRHVR